MYISKLFPVLLVAACAAAPQTAPQSAAPIASQLLGQTMQFCPAGNCNIKTEATGVVEANGQEYSLEECFSVTVTSGKSVDQRYGWRNRYNNSGC